MEGRGMNSLNHSKIISSICVLAAVQLAGCKSETKVVDQSSASTVQLSYSQSELTVSNSQVASASTINVTLFLRDTKGAALISTSPVVSFSAAGGTSTVTMGTISNNGDGTYTSVFTGATAGTATTLHASINGRELTSTLPTLTVTAAAGPARSWKGVSTLDNFPGAIVGYEKAPSISFDSSGNAFAMYRSPVEKVFKRKFSDTTKTWSGAVQIDSTAYPAGLGAPSIGVDSADRALTVYAKDDGTLIPGWIAANNAYTSGQALVSGEAMNVMTAVDGDSYAYSIWTDGGTEVVNVSNYDRGTDTWGAITPLGTGNPTQSTPQIGIDGTHNAFSVWVESDGSGGNMIYGSRIPSGGAWAAGARIDNPAISTNSLLPSIAVSSNGSAIVAWKQYNVNHWEIWAARYNAGWGAAVQLSTTGPSSNMGPVVSINASGNAVAVWSNDLARVHIKKFSTVTGWDAAATRIDDTSTASNPAVAIDASGNIAVAYVDSSPQVIKAVEYRSGAWGSIEALSPPATETSVHSRPTVVFSPNGDDVLVGWQRNFMDPATYADSSLVEVNRASDD
jgi:hypothetical protein